MPFDVDSQHRIKIPRDLLQKIHHGYAIYPDYGDGYSNVLRRDIRIWFLEKGYSIPIVTSRTDPYVIIDDDTILIEFKLTWL